MEHDQEHLYSLLFEKIAGTITDADNQLVVRELETNEELRAAWTDIQAKLGTHEQSVFLNQLDEQAAWKNVRATLEIDEQTTVRRPFQVYVSRPLAAAAMLVLLMSAGLYLYLRASRSMDARVLSAKKPDSAIQLVLANGKVIRMGEKGLNFKGDGVELSADTAGMSYHSSLTAANQWNTLLVPDTKDYKITLPDGSQVWLNSRSSIRFPLAFDRNKREVFIEGEVYFQVTHNAARPFIVHTPSTDIRVLGTSFNVNAYSRDSVSTSLVEGLVANTAANRTIYLKPGMQSLFNEQTGFTTREFDEDDVLSWMNGVYYFRHEELKQISGILERWFNVELVFQNKLAESHKLTGYINKNQPIQRFMDNLERTSGIKSRLTNNKLYIQ